jgi:hypothetical protein
MGLYQPWRQPIIRIESNIHDIQGLIHECAHSSFLEKEQRELHLAGLNRRLSEERAELDAEREKWPELRAKMICDAFKGIAATAASTHHCCDQFTEHFQFNESVGAFYFSEHESYEESAKKVYVNGCPFCLAALPATPQEVKP